MKKLSKIMALGVASSMALSVSVPAQATADPFVGEVMTVGFNFCPRGWALADGQLLAVSSNDALFSLLGTQFGGDGRTTFGLPDLRGRSIVGQGTGPGLTPIRIGEKGGRETVTLTVQNLPTHTHTGTVLGENAALGDTGNPFGNTLARTADLIYSDNSPPNASAKMHHGTLSVDISGGGNQSYSNRNPYVGMYTCIALFGVYPSRN